MVVNALVFVITEGTQATMATVVMMITVKYVVKWPVFGSDLDTVLW